MTKPRKPTADALERAKAIREAVRDRAPEDERRPGIRGPIRKATPEEGGQDDGDEQ